MAVAQKSRLKTPHLLARRPPLINWHRDHNIHKPVTRDDDISTRLEKVNIDEQSREEIIDIVDFPRIIQVTELCNKEEWNSPEAIAAIEDEVAKIIKKYKLNYCFL